MPALIALGDPTRRIIFERVATQPQSVSELARALPVSRPAVTRHRRGRSKAMRMRPGGLSAVRIAWSVKRRRPAYRIASSGNCWGR